MKYLIVGRTATGKDTLVNTLCNDPEMSNVMSKVISRTTRQPRSDNDTSHIFVTQDEANQDEPNKIARTVINGNEYYVLPEDLENKNLYIVDPKGVYDITKAMPDENFTIIYTCAKKYQQQEAFIKRLQETSDISKEEAEKEFNKRFDSENEQFTKFEESFINDKGKLPENAFKQNVVAVLPFYTDYTDAYLKRNVKTLYTNQCALTKLVELVPKAIKAGLLEAGDKPDTIKTFTYDGTDGILNTEYMIAQMLTDSAALSSFLISLLLVTDTYDKN